MSILSCGSLTPVLHHISCLGYLRGSMVGPIGLDLRNVSSCLIQYLCYKSWEALTTWHQRILGICLLLSFLKAKDDQHTVILELHGQQGERAKSVEADWALAVSRLRLQTPSFNTKKSSGIACVTSFPDIFCVKTWLWSRQNKVQHSTAKQSWNKVVTKVQCAPHAQNPWEYQDAEEWCPQPKAQRRFDKGPWQLTTKIPKKDGIS